MKKKFSVVTLVALIFSLVPYSQARLIGTNPTGASADLVCFGGRIAGNVVKSATEACLDSNGNWIPTTTGAAGINNLGSGTLLWNSIFINTVVANQQFTPLTTTTLVGTTAASGPWVGQTCGNVPNVMVTGTNYGGRITLGTATAAACTLAFSPTVFVNTPSCIVSVENNAVGVIANPIILPTSVQFNTTLPASAVLDYQCVGQGK